MGLTLGFSGGSLGFSRKGLFVLCLFLGAFIFSQGCVSVTISRFGATAD